MIQPQGNQQRPGFEPLVDDEMLAPKSKHKQKKSFRDRLNDTGSAVLYGPWKTKKARKISVPVAGALVVMLGVGAYLHLRPTPMPNFREDPLDRVFGYTLLTADFNKLPVEQRLELIATLTQRLGNMSASDAGLMAAFAAGIAGEGRRQLEENFTTLMVDTWDLLATEHEFSSPEERERSAEDSYVRLVRILSTFDGRPDERSREEILAEGRREAQRGVERLAERRPSDRRTSRLFRFANEDVGGQASPQQKSRISVLMRDMTRTLRNEDVQTGKPKNPGGG
ncbi:MAG: hypothetical protein EA423_00755 [Phycisphaerales bacterium]|nr:MAG: hypothetical protein EA423_00755 [Phycisphaerales bacterium]